jgi:hypothetical protein
MGLEIQKGSHCATMGPHHISARTTKDHCQKTLLCNNGWGLH